MRRRPGINGLLATVGVFLVSALLAYAYLYDYAPAGSPGAAAEGGASGPPQTIAARRSSPDSAGEYLGHSDSLGGLTFEDTRIGGLSALVRDPRRDLYYALVDREEEEPSRYYTLRLPFDGGRIGKAEAFGVTVLRDDEGRSFGAGRFDGEGIAVTPWGDLLMASETGPSLLRFSLDGRLLQKLPVPQKFLVFPRGEARANNSFEGVTFTPDGEQVIVAPQKALTTDEPLEGLEVSGEQRIRLLRYEGQGTKDLRSSGEFFYLAGSEGGVADIAAVSGNELLVLEHGNRLYRADLEGARDVSDLDTLVGSEADPLPKELIADLDECADVPAEIYEGLALGPKLAGGGRALLLVSDDDFDDDKTTGVTALGLWPASPDGETEPICR